MNQDFHSYEKKILSYLDGSLRPEEVSEFEAFVLTHPEIEVQVNAKKNEIQLIKSMIPKTFLSKETEQLIVSEMRLSIFNLLKEEPRGIIDHFRIKFEDYFARK